MHWKKKDVLHDENRFRAICKGLWDNETKREFEHLFSYIGSGRIYYTLFTLGQKH